MAEGDGEGDHFLLFRFEAMEQPDFVRVVDEKLDLQQISDSVASDQAGAIATFIGAVRGDCCCTVCVRALLHGALTLVRLCQVPRVIRSRGNVWSAWNTKVMFPW